MDNLFLGDIANTSQFFNLFKALFKYFLIKQPSNNTADVLFIIIRQVTLENRLDHSNQRRAESWCKAIGKLYMPPATHLGRYVERSPNSLTSDGLPHLRLFLISDRFNVIRRSLD